MATATKSVIPPLPIFNSNSYINTLGFQGPAGDPGSSVSGPTGATGDTYQFTDKIFLGSSAGETGQGSGGIAIGYEAGQTNQDINAIAIGRYAGGSTQGSYSIAIGTGAAKITASANSICIGNESGTFSAGENSIGIGSFCGGTTGISSSSIILNASGNFFSSGTTGFFVKPIRGNQGNSYVLGFNDSTNEITYENGGATDKQLTIFSRMGRLLKTFDTNGSTGSITLSFTINSGLATSCLGKGMGINGTGKYVGIVDDGNLGSSLWISNDYGVSFTNVLTAAYLFPPTFSESGQYVVVGGSPEGLFVSNDYGVSFTQISYTRGIGLVTMSCNGKLMYSGGNIFVGNYCLWYSTDYGVNWTSQTPPTSEDYQQMICDATGKYLLLSNINGGIYSSNDFGVTWTNVASNCSTLCSISASGQYQSYIENDNITIQISTDFGNTFQSHTTGTLVSPPCFSTTGQYGIACSTSGVWITEDYGNSWYIGDSYTGYSISVMSKSGESFYCGNYNNNILHTYNYN